MFFLIFGVSSIYNLLKLELCAIIRRVMKKEMILSVASLRRIHNCALAQGGIIQNFKYQAYFVRETVVAGWVQCLPCIFLV